MNNFLGVIARTPYVRPDYTPHVHDWIKEVRDEPLHSLKLKVNVCYGHDKPIVKAYDMEVIGGHQALVPKVAA